jgi:aryl-alcohol dehydrogenase-like predicted oxidoreductase
MQYRALGRTGLNVSVVGLGTWQWGGEWGTPFTLRQAREIVQAARDAGINLIDTAECYGDHLAETLVGETIGDDRDRWIVASKFGHQYHGPFRRTEDYSAAAMVRQLEASLRALKTDRIDLYQVHGLSPSACEDEALWAALEKQRESGKIGAIGVSMLYYPERLARPEIQVLQTAYNRLETSAETTVCPVCRERGLGVLVRSPLAGGLLPGQYAPGHRWGDNDVRGRQAPEEMDAKLREAGRILERECPPDVEPATWALAWCLRHPAVTAVIPGCRNARQLRINAAAAEMKIP